MKQEDGRAGRFLDCSHSVIGACIEVHRVLGPGLLESTYEACLAHELEVRGLSFERQKSLAVRYKGVSLECGYRMDFVVNAELVIELKAVERLLPVHVAQVISYLRLRGIQTGLLVNFHSETIQRGLRRLERDPPKNLPTFRLPVDLSRDDK
jgi:GxxExxY protein